MNITIQQEAQLARNAVRGERAIKAAGYLNPTQTQISTAAATNRTLRHAVIDLSTPGTYEIIVAAPGQAIEIMALFLWSSVDQNLEFFNGSKTLTGPLTAWPAQQGLLYPFVDQSYFEMDRGMPFSIAFTEAGQLSGWAKFRIV